MQMIKPIYISTMILMCLSMTLMSCGKEKGNEDVGNNIEIEAEDIKENNKMPDVKDVDNNSDKASEESIEELNEEAKKLYEDFLAGNAKLYTDKYEFTKYDMGEELAYYKENQGYTIEEFFKYIVADGNSDIDNAPLENAEYAYIDCGDDGISELAIKGEFEYMYDTLTMYYVIKAVDGKLELTYQDTSYYRSFMELANYYGKVTASVSYGAVTNNNKVGYLNSDGRYELACSETTTYDAVSVFNDELINASGDVDSYTSQYLKLFIFVNDNGENGNDRFYCAQKEADEPSNGIDFSDNVKIMQELFDKAGIRLYTLDEIENMRKQREGQLGITDKIKESSEITWENIALDKEAINAINSITAIQIRPGKEENFRYEERFNCYIKDEDTGEVYHIDDSTKLVDGVPCYDGCDTMEWLLRYLTHNSATDDDASSPYYLSGLAMGDIWDIEVDENNNILKINSIGYWD